MTKVRNIFDLQRLRTFEERYEYLRCGGQVGIDTFGFDRWLNQTFYKSQAWRNARDTVIIRDNGCDLGVPGYEIRGRIYIHHMNPISKEEVLDGHPDIINPNYLICVSFETHQAIHYGDANSLPNNTVIERLPGDTTLW